ncbi:LacI family DNA-binding transcriptional regulator, partial [Streptomyces sp. NRRL F-4711]
MTRRLAQVAKKVGVSEATVSRVLNGKPGVSEATRQSVLSALDVLGYERPTQLRGERARLVGLVLPELQNPIFPAFAEVIGG